MCAVVDDAGNTNLKRAARNLAAYKFVPVQGIERIRSLEIRRMRRFQECTFSDC